jgi:hypothetical protein
MTVTRRDKAATIQLSLFITCSALVTLCRFPRENAAGNYKHGHGRKKHPKLNLLHRGVSIAPTPLG